MLVEIPTEGACESASWERGQGCHKLSHQGLTVVLVLRLEFLVGGMCPSVTGHAQSMGLLLHMWGISFPRTHSHLDHLHLHSPQ